MTSASGPRLDKRRRTYVRLVGQIHHALNEALNEEKRARGLNMTKIGHILGLGRSAISKKFDGRQNMTLETLADLAFALDRPVKVILPKRSQAPLGANRVSHLTVPTLASAVSAFESESQAAAAANNIPVFNTVFAALATTEAPRGLASIRQGLREDQ